MQIGRQERHPEPSDENHFLAAHVALLLSSLRHWTGRDLLDPACPAPEQARLLFEAPFVVLSHDAGPDPLLNYANRSALMLFELTWDELVMTPSRLTAEASERTERARLLAEVSAHGFIENYSGIRVSKGGRRFRIDRALVWNIVDSIGTVCGQAATFRDYQVIT